MSKAELVNSLFISILFGKSEAFKFPLKFIEFTVATLNSLLIVSFIILPSVIYEIIVDSINFIRYN